MIQGCINKKIRPSRRIFCEFKYFTRLCETQSPRVLTEGGVESERITQLFIALARTVSYVWQFLRFA